MFEKDATFIRDARAIRGTAGCTFFPFIGTATMFALRNCVGSEWVGAGTTEK